jgi:hypothetical protein
MSIARIFFLTLALTVISVGSFAAEAPKKPAAPTNEVPLSSNYKSYLIYPVLRYDEWYDRGSRRTDIFMEDMFGRRVPEPSYK